MHERVAPDRLGQPHRAVAERLELRRELLGAGERLAVEGERPQSDASRVRHGGTLTGAVARNENMF